MAAVLGRTEAYSLTFMMFRMQIGECQNLQDPMASILRGTGAYSLAYVSKISDCFIFRPSVRGFGLGSADNRGRKSYTASVLKN